MRRPNGRQAAWDSAESVGRFRRDGLAEPVADVIGANRAGVKNRLRPLADDLESWSHGEPVAVSPASRTERVIPES